jgi:SAM-dependent methyltransferase
MAGLGEVRSSSAAYRQGDERPHATGGLLAAAAQARIAELTGDREGVTEPMSNHSPAAADGQRAPDGGVRATWARGDYHRFAKATVWALGPVLVEASGVRRGDRLLDVAAGSGNVAIRAAEAGADVVASDLTLESLEAGRAEAEAGGLELDWVEGDAEALPFEDASFDVVTSCFGAIFAADHQAVADELVRVCRPGGTIALLAFTPEGLFGEFMGALAPHAPPPPDGALPPTLWGDPDHVRSLFGDRVEGLTLERSCYTESSPDPASYVELFKETFGPVVAIYESVADEPDRLRALNRDFAAFAERANSGPGDGPAEYRYEYLLIRARRA